MNIVSAILRFICGFALIVAAWVTYQRAQAHVAAGEPVQIAGITIGASPVQFSLALGIVALVGGLLIILGLMTLMKGKRAAK
jgi:hypothetical protein